jgi:hypothetical protein
MFNHGDIFNGHDITPSYGEDEECWDAGLSRRSYLGQYRQKKKRKTNIAGDKWSLKEARKVMHVLKDLKPYVFSVGGTYEGGNPSVYIKFKDTRLCSLRIGDHDGYSKYKYKWNLRNDHTEQIAEMDKHVQRYYHHDTDDLCKHINAYNSKIITKE